MMRYLRAIILVFLSSVSVIGADAPSKPCVIVLTDISNEPDDEESLVRYLVYANEFQTEGLIATTSTYLKKDPREDLLHRHIDAYDKVRENLSRHASNYPTAKELHSICSTGQPGFGMAAVGNGRTSAGSQRIIEVVDKQEGPVWICIWGGANTLAQAIWDVEKQRDKAGVELFISKLRVYAISDQDDAGHWLRPRFPKLFYICDPGPVNPDYYWQTTWDAISGDRRHNIGVMHRIEMVEFPWLDKHVVKNHGPLGALYPKPLYIMEGDTPSFLGLINNGLGSHFHPGYGGWGGRYHESRPWGETRKLWNGQSVHSRDTVTSDDNGRTETTNFATIWRWREHFQNDFAARMDWCVADSFSKANHNPIAVLNGDTSKGIIEINAKAGEVIDLSAAGTHDPDGDKVEIRWWIYPEAGTLWDPKARRFPENVKLTADKGPTTSLSIPSLPEAKAATVHIILEIRDNGTPNLWAYRRAILNIKP